MSEYCTPTRLWVTAASQADGDIALSVEATFSGEPDTKMPTLSVTADLSEGLVFADDISLEASALCASLYDNPESIGPLMRPAEKADITVTDYTFSRASASRDTSQVTLVATVSRPDEEQGKHHVNGITVTLTLDGAGDEAEALAALLGPASSQLMNAWIAHRRREMVVIGLGHDAPLMDIKIIARDMEMKMQDYPIQTNQKKPLFLDERRVYRGKKARRQHR